MYSDFTQNSSRLGTLRIHYHKGQETGQGTTYEITQTGHLKDL